MPKLSKKRLENSIFDKDWEEIELELGVQMPDMLDFGLCGDLLVRTLLNLYISTEAYQEMKSNYRQRYLTKMRSIIGKYS